MSLSWKRWACFSRRLMFLAFAGGVYLFFAGFAHLQEFFFHVDAEEAPVEEVGGYAGGAASGEGWQSLHAEVSILCKRTKPIFSTIPVTRALPIKNALRMSDTPSV